MAELTRKRRSLRFRQLPGLFAVCRLPAEIALPKSGSPILSLTQTPNEISLVSSQDVAPENGVVEKGWICFRLEGPFPFTATGVLASFIGPLADAAIPIFAISTFDTDYILIKEELRQKALDTLG